MLDSSGKIRILTAADADALVSFYHDLPPETVHWFEPFVPADRNALLAHLQQAAANEAISAGLVQNDGAISGHAFVLALSAAAPVFGCGLSPAARGQGHGRRIMGRVMEEADRRRVPRVTLTVFKDNRRARRLYESFGFVSIGEHACRQPGDSQAMERLTCGTAGGSACRALLQMLNGYPPDRAIWTADLSYWINGRRQDGTADPAWDTEEGYLELHRELGVMPYYCYAKFWAAKPIFNAGIRLATTREGNRTLRLLGTPIGTLREESVFMPDSCCEGIVKHMVETEADLDVLLYALEHRQLEPDNLDDYAQRRELWAKYDGLPGLGLPRSPLPALAYEWAGLQNMVMLMLDCEDKVRRALDLMERQEEPIIEAVCKLAPPLVHFPDNLASDNLTGYYDEHMRARHQARLAKLHAAGVKAAVHLDGTMRGLLPKLAAAGFDAIEALTPKPAGDLDVAEMRAVAGSDRLILWGGVPGALFAPPHTWGVMQAHVERTLSLWQGEPFVLGVADQVPPDGDVGFVKRIGQMLR